MSKSSKWDKAVSKSRGEVVEETALANADAPQSLDQIGRAEVEAMIGHASAGSLAARIAAGEIDAAPRILELQEGMEIVGLLYATGTTQLPNLNDPKQIDTVATYQIELRHPQTGAVGPRVSIVGSSQLDRDLPTRVGKIVVIAVGGMTKTKRGRQLREFFVGELKTPPWEQRAS